MRQPGEHVKLYYDADRHAVVAEGDYLRTGTGRLYLIQVVRVQQGGMHTGRLHLGCVVMERDHEIEQDAKVHTVHWYPRGETRKART